MRMIFISRHKPTLLQGLMANHAGYEMIHVGDIDAFDVDAVSAIINSHPGSAVCCVHPLIALRAASLGRDIGIFQNTKRAQEGEKPSFEAMALTISRWRVEGNALMGYEGQKRWDFSGAKWSVVRTADDGSKATIWEGSDPSQYGGGLGCFPTNDFPDRCEEYCTRIMVAILKS